MKQQYYTGLDVRKDTIAIAYTHSQGYLILESLIYKGFTDLQFFNFNS